jgi:pseudouridine synthase
MPSAKLVRIQKFLSAQGVASRRSVEKMIAAGRISVNGKVVTTQGTKIDPEKDKIAIDGQKIKRQAELIYFWINKPEGIISAVSNKAGEPTVVELLKSNRRLHPVGRLDKDSSGLMLLTNDGELTHRLTHPKYHIDKTYHVRVSGHVSSRKISDLSQGIILEEGITAPAQVEVLRKDQHAAWLQFIIHEGKHRQIRRMCMTVDLHVNELIRMAVGPIKLGNLKPGQFRPATGSEIKTLKQLVGLQNAEKKQPNS